MAGSIKLGALLGVLLVVALSEGKIRHRKIGIPPAGAPNVRARAPVWGQITQKLDNFNPDDTRTWTMRYMANDQFFQPGGPIFVFLGGEWTISAGYLMTGQMFDMARDHSGYMFYTEHRYYGESYPTPDYSADNLQYLSAKQALADLAVFVAEQKATIPGLADSKVIVVGGSYSASLATWAKLKYPEEITVGYASSAPLRAVADFFEYYEVVNDNIGLVSQECLQAIREGVAQTEELLTTPAGIETVSAAYGTCTLLNTAEPYRSFFFNSVAEVFAGIVQYAQPGDIQAACNTVLNGPGATAMDRLANFISVSWGGCIGDYDEFVDYYSSPALTTDAYRQWLYQTCTEYGYYQTTTSLNQPFGQTFPLDLFVQMCGDLYEGKFNNATIHQAVDATNVEYGALQPDITQVISVHGTVDPWHALGLLQDLNDQAPAIVVTGTSHCADLNSVNTGVDSPDMIAAKNAVKQTIAGWIA